MCGRYTLRKINLLRQLTLQSETEFPPRFNIAPTQQIAVIRTGRDGQQVLGSVRWGLIPSWQKSWPKVQPFNATAEKVTTSGMFKQAFGRRRCLIPADGFYEWRDMGDGSGKTPTFIHRPEDALFYFAGLWERWKPEDAEAIDTATLITTTPNATIKPIHNRMPVILDGPTADRWMDKATGAEELLGLLRPYEGELETAVVSKRVNIARTDDDGLIKPVNSA